MDNHDEKAGEIVDGEGIAAEQLQRFVERIERLIEEVKDLNVDKKDVFNEAVSAGFDKKALTAIIKIRAQDPNDVDQTEAMVHLYRQTLGC